jgi:hypothetical protein
MTINFERDGELIPTTQRKILGITMDTKKTFMLGLSISSFGNYGRLIAQMKDQKITESWSHMIKAKTLKTENDKGKFYVVEFDLGEKSLKMTLPDDTNSFYYLDYPLKHSAIYRPGNTKGVLVVYGVPMKDKFKEMTTRSYLKYIDYTWVGE